MKFFIVAIAFLACAFADVSELAGNYDYHHPELHIESEPIEIPQNSYLPPAHHEHHEHHEHHQHFGQLEHHEHQQHFGQFEHHEHQQHFGQLEHHEHHEHFEPQHHHEHHDHHEHHVHIPAPAPEYLPPVESVHHEPSPSFLPAAEDGYRYRTIRRRVFRHRQ